MSQLSAPIFEFSADVAEVAGQKILTLSDFSLRGWRNLEFKRVFDFAVAFLALLALLPLMLVIAFIIKMSVGGRVFFAHYRVGRNGETFPCYKFRTMIPNSADVLERYLADNPAAQEEWSAGQKLACDPRVTAIGLFMRKLSLDELPQFYNIIRGDMSLVGPRPVTSEELDRYGEYADDYVSVRPGLTGLWQISGRSCRTYKERVALDRFYVRRRTFLFDCAILLKTVPAVMNLHESA